MNKTILITGTSGALGNYLRRYFEGRGYDVIGTVGQSKPRKNEIPLHLENPETYKRLSKILETKKPDAVIHNAAVLKSKGSRKDMYAANTEGTENLLKLVKSAGCRNFIQISTVGIYGIRSLGRNRDESTKPIDIEAYGISKRKAEKKVRESGIPYSILRLPIIKYEGDTFIKKTAEGGGPVFLRKGEDKLVSSVTPEYAAGVCRYIIETGPLNGAYNCADSHTAWKELIKDHCRHENIEIRNKRKYGLFAAFRMGIVMGPIALFGQHTPGDRLKALMENTNEY